MHRFSKKQLSFLLILFFFIACSSKREMVTTFGDYDRDGDTEVSRDEFQSGMEESNQFDLWDDDQDELLTRAEWDRGFNNYASSYPYEERGLFDDWDTDGDSYVDNDEFNEGFFDMFDLDDDGRLSQDEAIEN